MKASSAICFECFIALEKFDELQLQCESIQTKVTDLFRKTHAEQVFLKQEPMDYEDFEGSVSSFNFESPEKEKETSVAPTYSCDVCGDRFTMKRDFKKHVKLAHLPANTELFPCSKCDDILTSDLELKLHNATAHPDDPSTKTFKCPICPRLYSNRKNLRRHYKKHDMTPTPEVPQICKNFLIFTRILNSH